MDSDQRYSEWQRRAGEASHASTRDDRLDAAVLAAVAAVAVALLGFREGPEWM